ncbi:MAG: mechanosensitive ion channel [Deltaproteobacteria bacterium]|jgi:small-conductance mechanosensitive channel|nr:mechanosensitive ion channel [Deltaproteobacteria bacterium]MBT6434070.1 mechanosensitive ion channel [Deltaproteobacteria bacterium]
MIELIRISLVENIFAAWVLVASLVATMLIVLVSRRFALIERRLQDRLKHLESVSTIQTDSPLDDGGETFREHGLESIQTRFRVMKRVVYPVVCLAWLIAICVPMLDKIPAALLSFLLGTVTVMVGIAARPFIENVIAGIVLAFTQPLRIGDTLLIDGHWGKVEDISLTYSIIQVWDWRRYIIPNSELLNKNFINYSLVDTFQWSYVEFWVSYEADLDEVKRLAMEATASSSAFVAYEEPSFWVMEMAKDGIRCWVAGWVDTPADGWTLTHDIRTTLSMSLHRNGITCHGFHHRVQADAPQTLPHFSGEGPVPKSESV